MRLTITLEYFTSPGEALFLIRPDGEPIAMEYVAEGRWKADLEVPQATKTLEYSFELHRDGQCVRREWKGRIVPVAGSLPMSPEPSKRNGIIPALQQVRRAE